MLSKDVLFELNEPSTVTVCNDEPSVEVDSADGWLGPNESYTSLPIEMANDKNRVYTMAQTDRLSRRC